MLCEALDGKSQRRLACETAVTAVLAALPIALLAWMMEKGEPGLFLGTFTYVLSGRLFNEGWDPIHAGFALDQPTIGKWYFWFTAFAVVWLPYMTLLQRLCVRQSKLRHSIFVVGLTVLCLFLVCLLTIPFWWLVQYIRETGWTPKRSLGVPYAIAWYLIVLWFCHWVGRFSRKVRSFSNSEMPN